MTDDPRPTSDPAAVERCLEELLLPHDPALAAALDASSTAGLPPHAVSRLEGRLLFLLAKMCGASRILEIGALGGYSTICLARALPPGGRIVSLEADPRHAQVARESLARAGLSAVAEVIEGPALESLPRLEREAPFDLFFLDADKENNPAYLAWATKLARPGSVIVADNVVRGGAVADEQSSDPGVVGVRRFLETAGRDPRLAATAIQTVGSKGRDGFAIAIVTR
jgi:predicted O-methyltransferase YrrM